MACLTAQPVPLDRPRLCCTDAERNDGVRSASSLDLGDLVNDFEVEH